MLSTNSVNNEAVSVSGKRALWLILIVAVAAVLRLYKLGDWSLWVDEAFTIEDALLNRFGTKPINYAFVKFFLMNFGVDEWVARIGPALAGILGVFVIFHLAKRAYDSRAGLLAALFLALSSWNIYWSQNSRHYSLVLLFALLCLYFFYSGFEEDRPWKVFLSLVFFGLGMKTHPSVAFLMPALVAYLVLLPLLRFEKTPGYNLRNYLVFFLPVLLGAVVYVPGYFNLLQRISSSRSGSPLHVFHTTVYYVQVPFVVVSGLMALWLLRARDRRGLFLGLGCGVPLFVLLVVSLFSNASSLYIYYTLPLYIILTAAFVADQFRRSRTSGFSIGAWGILSVLLLTQLTHVYYYFSFQHGDRPRWKEAAHFLMSHVAEGDAILSTAPPALRYYVMKAGKGPEGEIDLKSPAKVDWSEVFLSNPGKISWLSQTSLEDSKNRKAVWLVTNVRISSLQNVDPASRRWIRASFRTVRDYPAWTGGKDRTVKIYYWGSEGPVRVNSGPK